MIGGVDRALMREALLDALEALGAHRRAVVVIGAMAIYLQLPHSPVALAEFTKDSDLALDRRVLSDQPRIEDAMRASGFIPDDQPGTWISPKGIPVDLMTPDGLADPGGRRGARIPPHGRGATRRARGIEPAVVDFVEMEIGSVDPADNRSYVVRVASPASLVVAKAHKLFERRGQPDRLNDKDAHDVYRILRAVETADLAEGLRRALDHEVSREPTREAIGYLQELFAQGPDALGSRMAGRAEQGIGDPDQVAVAVSLLAGDLVAAVSVLVDDA